MEAKKNDIYRVVYTHSIFVWNFVKFSILILFNESICSAHLKFDHEIVDDIWQLEFFIREKPLVPFNIK